MSTNRIRGWLQRRSPYQSLIIIAVPFVLAEPAKLVAVAVFGSGHWLAGLIIMAIAYGVSIFVVHRCFKIMKPKLLKLRWFSKVWRWLTGLWSKVLAPFA